MKTKRNLNKTIRDYYRKNIEKTLKKIITDCFNIENITKLWLFILITGLLTNSVWKGLLGGIIFIIVVLIYWFLINYTKIYNK